jgi:hypothetical protein
VSSMQEYSVCEHVLVQRQSAEPNAVSMHGMHEVIPERTLWFITSAV